MNCPSCGNQIAAGGTFCGRCGTRVESNQAAPPSRSPHGINLDTDGQGAGRGYSYEILHQPAFSLAVLKLQAEQSIMAEAGAMVSMSANVELQSQMKGGLFGALKRAAGGESAFVSTSRPTVVPAKLRWLRARPATSRPLNLRINRSSFNPVHISPAMPA